MWLVRRDISRSLRTWVASWIRFFNWRSRDRENYFILQKKQHLEYAHGRTWMVLGSTDPACHSTLVLVEALDLGQVCRRWTLHLETLLEERRWNKAGQRAAQTIAFFHQWVTHWRFHRICLRQEQATATTVSSCWRLSRLQPQKPPR